MRANVPESVLRERVDTSGGPDACWPWTGQRSPRGYGKVVIRQKHWRAHRLAWITWVGPIPDETPHVLHSCDWPPCCNPAHLWLGTHADNQHDKWAKGRGRTNSTRGEDRPLSKLTDVLVCEIRQRYADGSSSLRLADDYGVSTSAIIAAVKGETWTHVSGAVPPRLPRRPRKLTDEDVAAIQSAPAYHGIHQDLARLYRVSDSFIHQIRKRQGRFSA